MRFFHFQLRKYAITHMSDWQSDFYGFRLTKFSNSWIFKDIAINVNLMRFTFFYVQMTKFMISPISIDAWFSEADQQNLRYFNILPTIFPFSFSFIPDQSHLKFSCDRLAKFTIFIHEMRNITRCTCLNLIQWIFKKKMINCKDYKKWITWRKYWFHYFLHKYKIMFIIQNQY